MTSDKTSNKTCPISPCVAILDRIRTQPEDLESFKARVCSNPLACPQYHILSGVNQAIIDAVENYNQIKQNTKQI